MASPFGRIANAWNRVVTAQVSATGQDANAAYTFVGGGVVGAAVVLSALPQVQRINGISGSYDSPVETGGGSLRVVVVSAAADAIIPLINGLPWQIGAVFRSSATDVYQGAAVPDLAIPSVVPFLAAPGIVAKPNGLTVHFDSANGAIPYSDVKAAQSFRGQSDGIITFPGRGLETPANAAVAVLLIAYRQLTELPIAAAETLAGQWVRGSVHGGPVEPQRLMAPDGRIVEINSDGTIGNITSLARFDATLSPPVSPPFAP